MRSDHIKKYLNGRTFAVCPSYMEQVMDALNAEEIARVETSDDIAPSHSYQIRENVALISLDGETIKKNNFINAVSGSYVPYDAILSYIDKAEQDEKITDIIFDIDTRGGDTEGVDRLGDRIFNSSKNTHTFYSNKGMSAGIWFGTASDKVYAEESAKLGSIGVMAMMLGKKTIGVMAMMLGKKTDSDEEVMVMVSEGAENKNCSLNGDCEEVVQSMINETGKLFYSRVTRNTGFSKERIKEVFDSGRFISATKAKEEGFIDEVTTLDSLIKSLVTRAVPSQEKPAAIQNKDITMSDQTDIDKAVALAKKRATSIAAIGASHGISAAVVSAAIEDDSTVEAFQTQVLATLQGNFEVATAATAEAENKLAEAIKTGASEDDGSTQTPKKSKDEDDTESKAILDAASKVEV